MMRSLFSGVAGLRTHQTKMDVIGNNIANVNTVGFKSSAVTFQDIMYQNASGASGATETMGGRNANQTGLGVTTGSTKISIEAGGAAQSTGQAFDLRFTDMGSTNFFIVSNGTQNLFTRAGSFYIDGAGNLAMTSTGYMVMGWQYDETTGAVRRDVVSPLRIMAPENQTSTPEFTTDLHTKGVLDKNDSDIVSEAGYINSVTVYDNLGYEYTVKFSTRLYDAETQQYTMKLDSIKDSNGIDILRQYIGSKLTDAEKALPENDPVRMKAEADALADVFGTTKEKYPDNPSAGKEKVSYDVSNKSRYPLDPTSGKVSFKKGDTTYYLNNDPIDNPLATPDPQTGNYVVKLYAPGSTTDFQEVKLASLYGMSDETYKKYVDSGATFSINNSGQLTVEYDATNYLLSFDAANGTLVGAGPEGGTSVALNLGLLGEAFSPVNLDLSMTLAYDNGGTSTMGMDRGQLDNISLGAGRKLGALNGLSVSQDGTIWGSYDNGTNRCLGQIPVARFANASGLESLGNNVYNSTLNSGTFDGIGEDVTADGGQINSGQLEMSNVDLSSEFTEMITTQRGFQANSRIITVSDTMLEELTNLKR